MRKIIYKILLSVNLIFAFTLLLSYLAVHISPARFALPALFGLAYPYILLANILLAITWALLLKYEALISVIVIAAGYGHLTNYLRLSRPDSETAGTFKVLSYNIRLFNAFEKGNKGSEKEILEFLKKQEADIICLQEFYGRGNPDQKVREIRDYLGNDYQSHLKVIGSGRNRFYGVVTFSRFPVAGRGEIIHPHSPALTIFTDVIISRDTFRIFNNHLHSFGLKSMEKSFIEEVIQQEEGNTLGGMKDLSLSLKNGFVRRAQQAELLKGQINLSAYPVIVAGDFNDTPVSYTYTKIRKGLGDAFVNSGYGAGFTYRGNYPANRIDYIFYDNAFKCKYFDIVKIRYSDHYPVVAYFTLSR
ncbi:MAG TPA: endonuclease/exonuclease/phosphatase family protein [Bacteroidales bacterium]|nr:endonuclease/exonuclease/phosphatase family protein [Bacteroidales bacterium]HOS72575.1 endonuclease/exonuclease/phosphatase family protein [Bacteroidales bacterium]HQH24234.1 endonuclease/exonuclease/phosphatase family protein [Bacteroidales bacterium]HQJ82695.1 endonuclease/exonuclease/phosphatase family protein [Bacteroidales bacterium]